MPGSQCWESAMVDELDDFSPWLINELMPWTLDSWQHVKQIRWCNCLLSCCYKQKSNSYIFSWYESIHIQKSRLQSFYSQGVLSWTNLKHREYRRIDTVWMEKAYQWKLEVGNFEKPSILTAFVIGMRTLVGAFFLFLRRKRIFASHWRREIKIWGLRL